MPLYKFSKCEQCKFEEISLFLNYNDYAPEIDCPCGQGKARRLFSNFSSVNGMTVRQKELGVKQSRIDAGRYMKEQTETRKKEYPADSRQANTNEYWTGTEGLDGLTQLPDLK